MAPPHKACVYSRLVKRDLQANEVLVLPVMVEMVFYNNEHVTPSRYL